MSLMLAWGKNFMPLTDFFLDYFPGYNKFRAVSMILVIAEFTIPLLAFIALNKFLSSNSKFEDLKKLKIAFYTAGGITLIFALFPNMFLDFLSEKDLIPISSGVKTPDGFLDGLIADRSSLLQSDSWRSFLFILLSFGVLFAFIKEKLNKKYAILLIGALLIADMWNINKRYLNDEHFVRKNKVKNPYKPTQADNFILKDKDPNFRVFNQSVSTFNDASTSYFHKSIGGYHGAKLKRYQELIEFHISRGNMSVLNMLNTKYFITQDGRAQINAGALGNAWLIEDVKIVKNADEEIAALGNFDPSKTIIVDERFKDNFNKIKFSSLGTIKLDSYQPNNLKYTTNLNEEGLAIFSEIYYKDGWNAYIDGIKTEHFRANYVLRAMKIPAGNHSIEFKFEPSVFISGERISLASSISLILLLIFACYREFKLK